jgi:hypothetical protein
MTEKIVLAILLDNLLDLKIENMFHFGFKTSATDNE